MAREHQHSIHYEPFDLELRWQLWHLIKIEIALIFFHSFSFLLTTQQHEHSTEYTRRHGKKFFHHQTIRSQSVSLHDVALG